MHAVCDLSLEVRAGETLVFLGTSGSGKTTTMKMINRLIDPTSGTITIDGENIMDLDPNMLRRKIGYAIQHIGLFPHMTVEENIAIVPKLLGWKDYEISDRVDFLLNMMGMNPEEFRKRYPKMLSSGQKQRIGVARALAADPPIILMDEPFGALDPITREQTQKEFIELESEIQKTIVFVTHDIFEAIILGDRIALFDEGKLLQLSTPAELVDNPANEFVDQFLGMHRFHLSLLTKTIKEFPIKSDHPTPPEHHLTKHKLSTRDTLIDALDLFKVSKSKSLPVFAGKVYQGELAKGELLDKVINILMVEKNL